MIDQLFLSLALMLTPCNEVGCQIKTPIRDQFGTWQEVDFKIASHIGFLRRDDDRLWAQMRWEGLPDGWWVNVGGSSTNCNGASGYCREYKTYVLVPCLVKLYRSKEEYEANDPILWFYVWMWDRERKEQ